MLRIFHVQSYKFLKNIKADEKIRHSYKKMCIYSNNYLEGKLFF